MQNLIVAKNTFPTGLNIIMTQARKKRASRRSKSHPFRKNVLFIILAFVLGFAALSILGKNGILDLIKLQGMQQSLEKRK